MNFLQFLMIMNVLVTAAVLVRAHFRPFLFSPGFDIEKTAVLSESLPSHSWEYGTAAESLLELFNPEFSVFGSAAFPIPTLRRENVRALAYAASKIVIGTGANSLSDGDGAGTSYPNCGLFF